MKLRIGYIGYKNNSSAHNSSFNLLKDEFSEFQFELINLTSGSKPCCQILNDYCNNNNTIAYIGFPKTLENDYLEKLAKKLPHVIFITTGTMPTIQNNKCKNLWITGIKDEILINKWLNSFNSDNNAYLLQPERSGYGEDVNEYLKNKLEDKLNIKEVTISTDNSLESYDSADIMIVDYYEYTLSNKLDKLKDFINNKSIKYIYFTSSSDPNIKNNLDATNNDLILFGTGDAYPLEGYDSDSRSITNLMACLSIIREIYRNNKCSCIINNPNKYFKSLVDYSNKIGNILFKDNRMIVYPDLTVFYFKDL